MGLLFIMAKRKDSKLLEPRERVPFPRDAGYNFVRSKRRVASRCWRWFQDTFLGCFCCFRTRSSMENMLDCYATKWSTQDFEAIVVHDILSLDFPEIKSSNTLEVTAMIHAAKDDVDKFDSSSRLCVEDDTQLDDIPMKIEESANGGYSVLLSNEDKERRAVENSASQDTEKKGAPKEEGVEENSEPAREK